MPDRSTAGRKVELDATVWAIIPAAGSGTRLGSPVPKQFLEVAGRPVLGLTLQRILSSPMVSGAVVVLPLEWHQTGELIASSYSEGKEVRTVLGGLTRQESVRAGLASLPGDASWVLVHDASRPNVSGEMIDGLIQEAFRTGAAIPVVPLHDAIRKVSGGVSAGTEIWREELVAVQTPQVFARELLVRAHLKAMADGYTGQDDSELVQRLGHPVSAVPGSKLNFKITTREDLVMQEALEHYRKIEDIRKQTYPRRYGRWPRKLRGPAEVRTGLGVDVHRFGREGPCVLGGVTIPDHPGLEGHSDGDVVCHAIMDALLGAAGNRDIGHWFPPGDPRYRGASSLALLQEIRLALSARWDIVNVDVAVVAQEPTLAPYCDDICRSISSALGVSRDRVAVKATTPENLGELGRGEGIACLAVACIVPRR